MDHHLPLLLAGGAIMSEQTRVVFRKWGNGDIWALFPEIEESTGCCSSYMHIGQHGAAYYPHCIGITKPADADEYASLEQELTSIGYDLQIRQRR